MYNESKILSILAKKRLKSGQTVPLPKAKKIPTRNKQHLSEV